MIDTLWSFITWLFYNLPWLFMALAAAMAMSKRKKSLPLMLQVLGALGCFLVAAIRWLVMWLLGLMHAHSVTNAAWTIFSFLAIVAILLFTAGFCWEKFQQWREEPASAQAIPVQ